MLKLDQEPILQIFYESQRKLMKATIFHGIFFVKSLTFVLFHSIVMHYLYFMISYSDKRNFSVCYCTVSPLGDIGKYFTIVEQKVIRQISQILKIYPPFFLVRSFQCTKYIVAVIEIPIFQGQMYNTKKVYEIDLRSLYYKEVFQ